MTESFTDWSATGQICGRQQGRVESQRQRNGDSPEEGHQEGEGQESEGDGQLEQRADLGLRPGEAGGRFSHNHPRAGLAVYSLSSLPQGTVCPPGHTCVSMMTSDNNYINRRTGSSLFQISSGPRSQAGFCHYWHLIGWNRHYWHLIGWNRHYWHLIGWHVIGWHLIGSHCHYWHLIDWNRHYWHFIGWHCHY